MSHRYYTNAIISQCKNYKLPHGEWPIDNRNVYGLFLQKSGTAKNRVLLKNTFEKAPSQTLVCLLDTSIVKQPSKNFIVALQIKMFYHIIIISLAILICDLFSRHPVSGHQSIMNYLKQMFVCRSPLRKSSSNPLQATGLFLYALNDQSYKTVLISLLLLNENDQCE